MIDPAAPRFPTDRQAGWRAGGRIAGLALRTIRSRWHRRAPLCNGRAHTALRWGPITMPLCARCSGIVSGCLVSAALTLGAAQNTAGSGVSMALAGCLPALLDGLRSYGYLPGRSSNPTRFATGLLLGLGLCFIL